MHRIIERKPYADRTKRTEYPKRHTVRNEIRSVLDDLIRRKPKDREDFLRLLAEEGYEIKRGKNIVIKGRAQQRFNRLELQEAARAAFDQLPEGTKLPTVKELNAERTRLIQERQAEYAEYRKVKADRTEFIRAKQNADVILNRRDAVRDEKQLE